MRLIRFAWNAPAQPRNFASEDAEREREREREREKVYGRGRGVVVEKYRFLRERLPRKGIVRRIF